MELAADPEHECFEIAYELATHALAQPGVAGLHFISFRKDAGISEAAHVIDPSGEETSRVDSRLGSAEGVRDRRVRDGMRG